MSHRIRDLTFASRYAIHLRRDWFRPDGRGMGANHEEPSGDTLGLQ